MCNISVRIFKLYLVNVEGCATMFVKIQKLNPQLGS